MNRITLGLKCSKLAGQLAKRKEASYFLAGMFGLVARLKG
jgi:hypothetical protein